MVLILTLHEIFHQLFFGASGLFGLRRDAMPCRRMFHERDALAFDRASENEDGFSSSAIVKGSRLGQGLHDLLHVVAIDVETCQPKARHLSVIGSIGMTSLTGPSIWPPLLSRITTRLESLNLARGHRAFPDLAFLNFAVADHAVDHRFLAVELETQRHALGDGEALSERSGRGFDDGESARDRDGPEGGFRFCAGS